MEATPTQSIQQTAFESYQSMIREKGKSEVEIQQIIRQILENSNVNNFGEFLQIPEILQLKTGPNEKYYNTLNLFAYGTYKQFLENKDKLIPLTPLMEKKLKHLTILSLAIQKKTLPYDSLMSELDIKNVRDLEDLIIEAIYAELINGKLDQKNRQLEIDYAVARDIQTENIKEIISILNDWLKSCESCSNCLQEQIERANAEKTKRLKHKEYLEQELTKIKKNLKKQPQTQNFEDQSEDTFMQMGNEKNLNQKTDKRGGKNAKPGKSGWFNKF